MRPKNDEISSGQIRAFLERNAAGHFGPDELDRFMKRPHGPIIPEATRKVVCVPNFILEPNGVHVIFDTFSECVLCEGYDNDETDVVVEIDDRGITLKKWRLWERKASSGNVFLGFYKGEPLWFGTSSVSKDKCRLYIGQELFEKRFSIAPLQSSVGFRDMEKLTEVDGILLTPNSTLYLSVFNKKTDAHHLLDVEKNRLSAPIPNVSTTVRFGLTHDGQVIATYVTGNGSRRFINTTTGEVFPVSMNVREQFLGFWIADGGTHAVGRERDDSDSSFTMPLSGFDTRRIPCVPCGQILGLRCLAGNNQQMPVWKVRNDGSVYYTIGSKPQHARFDAVSEIFNQDGTWRYWGLTGRHMFLMELAIS